MKATTVITASKGLVLAVAFGLTAVIPAVTHDVPLGDYRKDRGPAVLQKFADSRNLDEPTNVPAWSWVEQDFPACSGDTDRLAEDVVVVDQQAEGIRMDLDRAHALTHDDEPANDVWVVGTC